MCFSMPVPPFLVLALAPPHQISSTMRIEARAKHEPISHVAVLSGTSLAPGIIEATPALHASLRYRLRELMAALNIFGG